MNRDQLNEIFRSEALSAVEALHKLVNDENPCTLASCRLARDLAEGAHLAHDLVMESLALELCELLKRGKTREAQACVRELSRALESGAAFSTSSFKRALLWTGSRRATRSRATGRAGASKSHGKAR